MTDAAAVSEGFESFQLVRRSGKTDEVLEFVPQGQPGTCAGEWHRLRSMVHAGVHDLLARGGIVPADVGVEIKSGRAKIARARANASFADGLFQRLPRPPVDNLAAAVVHGSDGWALVTFSVAATEVDLLTRPKMEVGPNGEYLVNIYAAARLFYESDPNDFVAGKPRERIEAFKSRIDAQIELDRMVGRTRGIDDVLRDFCKLDELVEKARARRWGAEQIVFAIMSSCGGAS